jgi:hypothetical protein
LLVASGLVVTIAPPALSFAGDSDTGDGTAVAQSGGTSQTLTQEGTAARVAADVIDVPGAALGPFVLRGSGPLGPALATAKGDPTPSIDRDERAFDLSAGGSGAGIDAELLLGLTASRPDAAANAPSAPQSAGPKEKADSLNSIRGPGGFPVLSSSPDGVQQCPDPASLLATLSPRPDDSAKEEDLVAQISIKPLLPSRSGQIAGEESGCTDFVAAAFGLVLGVGLTGGPLFPDLIALVRTCRPRTESPDNQIRPRGSSLKRSLLRLRSWLLGNGGGRF